MQADDFLKIYQRLGPVVRDAIDEQLGEIALLEERRDDLIEHLDSLSPSERAQLVTEQQEFLREADEEREDLANSRYTAADADEEDMHRQSNVLDSDNDTYAIVTSTYPLGVDWLNADIESAQEKIRKLVAAA